MEKRISVTEYRAAVNIAKACSPITTKRESIKAKIAKLQEEYDSYDAQIQAFEQGIKTLTGFRVEEIVKKVVETTGTDAKTGKPIKTTKYIPTNIVKFDETTKQYVITAPDENLVMLTTENVAGNDYDIDKENIQKEEAPEAEDTFTDFEF